MSELTQRKDQLLNQLINYLSYLLQYHCCGTGKCLLYCKYILILLHGMLQGYCTRSSLRPISFSRAKKNQNRWDLDYFVHEHDSEAKRKEARTK
jgi:hypothetical protein